MRGWRSSSAAPAAYPDLLSVTVKELMRGAGHTTMAEAPGERPPPPPPALGKSPRSAQTGVITLETLSEREGRKSDELRALLE